MAFLASSSAGASLIAGAMIVIGWIIAINDDVMMKRKCGGCIKYFHNERDGFKNEPLGNNDVFKYMRLNKDAYTLMLAFAIILGVFWIVTGILAFVKPTFHLVAGILTKIIFICIFTPLLERMRFNQQCLGVEELRSYKSAVPAIATFANICSHAKNPLSVMKYMYSSYEMFWATSMICFLLGAYQIICAIAMVYEEQMAEYFTEQKNQPEPAKEIHEQPEVEKPPDDERHGETAQPDIKLPQEIEHEEVEQTPDKEAQKSFRMVPAEEPVEQFRREPLDSILKSHSKIVRKGEVTPPQDSPVPPVTGQDFSLNNI